MISKKNIIFKREVIIALFAIFTWSATVYGATVEELQSQINSITATKQQLEAEIAAYEKQLKDLGLRKAAAKS